MERLLEGDRIERYKERKGEERKTGRRKGLVALDRQDVGRAGRSDSQSTQGPLLNDGLW